MNHSSNTTFYSQGTTLIEVLMYVGIVALISTTLIQFALTAITNSTKSSTQEEVSSVGRAISRRIQSEIRNATDIVSISSTQISLSSSNPTVIAYTGGNVTIQQGAGSPVNLNSANTTIPTFSFTDYSSTDGKTKHIRFEFTIQASYGSSTKQEYTDSLSFDSSAELRNR